MSTPTPDHHGLTERARTMARHYEGMRGDLDRIQESGTGGRGLVVASADGAGRLGDLRIDPSLLEPGGAVDAVTLADYVLEACNAALDAVMVRRTEKLSAVTHGLREALDGLRTVANTDGATILAQRGLVPREPDRPTGGIRWGSSH
jgi:DNA-binding protein YbaB